MFDYEKMFEPYTGNGATLKKSIKWVKKSAEVDDIIMDQVVADTMNLISQGEKFELPCKCGCGLDHVNVPIEHFMLYHAKLLDAKAKQAWLKVIEENERQRLQARMKTLVNSDKQMFEAYHGNWWQRNMPTFRKWLRFKD